MNVKKQTGDQLVSELAIPAIDLIKIDVEGHEYEVLDGLRQTISQHQPLLMLEWADAVATRRIRDNQLLKTLFTGYSIQVLGSNHDKQYWRSKPLGKWRRKLTRLLQKKRPVLYPFDIDQTYENILLIPPEKRKLVEQAGTN